MVYKYFTEFKWKVEDKLLSSNISINIYTLEMRVMGKTAL